MKNLKNHLAAFAFLVGALLFLPLPVRAAAKAATAANGKTVYFATKNVIYSMNTNTGKVQKVKQLTRLADVSDISYYNGYLYFTGNYYEGTDSWDCYICRLKANGTRFSRLATGYGARVCSGKIYYYRTKRTVSGGMPVHQTIGLGRMSLNGSNQKTLVKGEIQHLSIWNGKLCYLKNGENGIRLFRCSLKGTDEEEVPLDPRFIPNYYVTDGEKLICADFNKVYLVNPDGSGKLLLTLKLENGNPFTNVLGIKKEELFLSDVHYGKTSAFYSVNIKTGKKTSLGSRSVESVAFGSGSYFAFDHYVGEKIQGGKSYNYITGRMNTKGRGYKIIDRYFVS